MAHDPFGKKAAETFLEGAATAAKWPKVGYVVEGTVLTYSMQQRRDYDSNEALYWVRSSRVKESETDDKSRPVMQMTMEVQGKPTGETWEGTAYNRVEIPDDDGVRTLYIKGRLKTALTAALKRSGGKLEPGAYVRIERIKDAPKTNPKYAAPHDYTAVWTPAAQNPEAAAGFLAEDDGDSPF